MRIRTLKRLCQNWSVCSEGDTAQTCKLAGNRQIQGYWWLHLRAIQRGYVVIQDNLMDHRSWLYFLHFDFIPEIQKKSPPVIDFSSCLVLLPKGHFFLNILTLLSKQNKTKESCSSCFSSCLARGKILKCDPPLLPKKKKERK